MLKKSILILALFAGGCVNERTPEGHVGYIIHRPLAYGSSEFVGTQVGPTSTGLVWRQFVTNVDVRPKTYTEEFHILSRDNLNVGFQVHAIVSIDPAQVQRLVEEMGDAEMLPARDGSTPPWPVWYWRAVRQPFRTAVRDVVHGVDAYDIQSETASISANIIERLREHYADSPIRFESVSIGNLEYPEAINAEIQRKLAAEQDLGRMERERQIAEQEAQIAVANARGRANAQRIVNETLTPLYVQHEALEGLTALARSSRVHMVVAPASDSGASPVLINTSR